MPRLGGDDGPPNRHDRSRRLGTAAEAYPHQGWIRRLVASFRSSSRSIFGVGGNGAGTTLDGGTASSSSSTMTGTSATRESIIPRLLLCCALILVLRNVLFRDYREEEMKALKASGKSLDEIHKLYLPPTRSEQRMQAETERRKIVHARNSSREDESVSVQAADLDRMMSRVRSLEAKLEDQDRMLQEILRMIRGDDGDANGKTAAVLATSSVLMKKTKTTTKDREKHGIDNASQELPPRNNEDPNVGTNEDSTDDSMITIQNKTKNNVWNKKDGEMEDEPKVTKTTTQRRLLRLK